MTEIRDIALFLDARPADAAPRAAAAMLAREHGAFVTGVCRLPEPEPLLTDCYAVGPQGAADVVAHREAARRERSAPYEATFRYAMAEARAGAAWRVIEVDEPVELTTQQARAADLLVMLRPSETSARRQAEGLVMGAGAPALLVPEAWSDHRRFDRVVVGWNGSRAAQRALTDAMPLLARAAQVDVVVVEDPHVQVSGQARDDLLRHLGHHQVRADVLAAPPSESGAGRALLHACRACEADLLVMGAYGRLRVAEELLGGTTRSILQEAWLPVLLSH